MVAQVGRAVPAWVQLGTCALWAVSGSLCKAGRGPHGFRAGNWGGQLSASPFTRVTCRISACLLTIPGREERTSVLSQEGWVSNSSETKGTCQPCLGTVGIVSTS